MEQHYKNYKRCGIPLIKAPQGVVQIPMEASVKCIVPNVLMMENSCNLTGQ